MLTPVQVLTPLLIKRAVQVAQAICRYTDTHMHKHMYSHRRISHIPPPVSHMHARLEMSSRLDEADSHLSHSAGLRTDFGTAIISLKCEVVRACSFVCVTITFLWNVLRRVPFGKRFMLCVRCTCDASGKVWLNVCGSRLSQTNEELLCLCQSNGHISRLWSNHVKPDLMSAVKSTFSGGKTGESLVLCWCDTSAHRGIYLQSAPWTHTHAALWKRVVCVPIQCKSCRFFLLLLFANSR